jgi:hypothetical protein
MSDATKKLRLALRLVETRDTMRSLFGDAYHAKCAPWSSVLRDIMNKMKCDSLRALLHVKKELEQAGHDVPPLAIAAAVDLAEHAAEMEG